MTNPIIDIKTASILNKNGESYCLMNFEKFGFKVGDVINFHYYEEENSNTSTLAQITIKKEIKLKVAQRFKVQDYKTFKKFVESNNGKIAPLDFYKDKIKYHNLDVTKYHIAFLEKVE